MARNKTSRQVTASQITNRLKVLTAHMKPAATSAGSAATRGVRATRKWSAPRVERTGQVLQDNVAPKVASALSSAAQRLDPGKPRVARWRRPAGIAAVSATASAVAVVLRRRKPGAASSSPADQDGLAHDTKMGYEESTTSPSAAGKEGTS
jgi:hypothetical protein